MLHKSTLMDIRLWLINVTVLGFAYTWLAISALWVRSVTIGGLNSALGEHAPTAWPWGLAMSLTTVAALLAYELGYWFSHFLFHRYASVPVGVPQGASFGRGDDDPHRAAPASRGSSRLRQCDRDLDWSVTLGALTYIFGPGGARVHVAQRQHRAAFVPDDLGPPAPLPTLVGVHRRGRAGLFQSPAHHQLHHSDHPDHFNKNLGYSLAVWDWLFGTLVIPHPDRRVQNVHFGLGETNGDFEHDVRRLRAPVRALRRTFFARAKRGERPGAFSRSLSAHLRRWTRERAER